MVVENRKSASTLIGEVEPLVLVLFCFDASGNANDV